MLVGVMLAAPAAVALILAAVAYARGRNRAQA